jgi:hypothetical protein
MANIRQYHLFLWDSMFVTAKDGCLKVGLQRVLTPESRLKAQNKAVFLALNQKNVQDEPTTLAGKRAG